MATVGIAIINHPPNHHFNGWYKPSKMGGANDIAIPTLHSTDSQAQLHFSDRWASHFGHLRVMQHLWLKRSSAEPDEPGAGTIIPSMSHNRTPASTFCNPSSIIIYHPVPEPLHNILNKCSGTVELWNWTPAILHKFHP